MADILDQIQRRQIIEQEQELATAAHDLDWNKTFGRFAPDHVLRESRNMTAMIANAVEGKMKLLAQTDEGAHRIYVANERLKAEQRMQPLKDERLIGQIRAGEAQERATEAQERLTTSRLERDALGVEHTASAEWEMDELENSSRPEAEKRAWLNTVRGRYPKMSKDTAARHEGLHKMLNPTALTPDEKIANSVKMAAATTATRNALNAAAKEPPKTDAERIAFEVERKKALAGPESAKPDSYEQLRKDEENAKARRPDLTPEQQKQFARREQALITAGRQEPAAASSAAAATAAVPVQFKDESEARAGGAKTGDIVIIINPATGKPARARIN